MIQNTMSKFIKEVDGQKRHSLFSVDLSNPKLKDPLNFTIEDLRKDLQFAVEVEHSTIPPYLCALYSIAPDTNSFASNTIRSVVMEEMLHMVQAANILNAIGGSPSIDNPTFIPEYPTYLPHSDEAFLVDLMKFSRSAIDTFLLIEKPAPAKAPPQLHNYHSLGQFYEAIAIALTVLDRVTPGGIFTGDPARQVGPEQYYGSGGDIIPVHCLDDAIRGIEMIVDQGEGADGTIDSSAGDMFGEEIEYAHYFKYMEIRHKRRYLPGDNPNLPPTGPRVKVNYRQVLDMHPNPKLSDYPVGSPLYNKTLEFNRVYMKLLHNLHEACNGQPDLLMTGVALMYDLKYKAIELMNIPREDGTMAGPGFEYVAVGDR